MIELYTADGCNLCVEAKKSLNEQSLQYQEYLIGRDITREEVKAKFPGVAMLPVLVVDGTVVSNPASFRLLSE